MRAAVVSFLVLGLVWVVPAAAWADPAVPTNWESRVTQVEPSTPGLTVEVVGGDAFLEVHNDTGEEVVVLGYEDEPYLRFAVDGTVAVNLRSPAHYLNADRYGARAPAGADADAEPRWEPVADGGTYAWHDHRIHWMNPSALPPPIRAAPDREQVFQSWAVPLRVGATTGRIAGELVWHPSVVPTGAIVAGLVALVLVAAAASAAPGRRRRTAAGAASLAGAIAVVVSWGEVQAAVQVPPLATIGLTLAAAAVVVGVVAVVLDARGNPRAQLAVGLAVLLPAAWSATRVGGLTKPVLPNLLDTPVAHTTTGAVLGLVIGAAVALALANRARAEPPEAGAAPDAA